MGSGPTPLRHGEGRGRYTPARSTLYGACYDCGGLLTGFSVVVRVESVGVAGVLS